MKGDEVNKFQEEMISDVLEGFIPQAASASAEETTQPVEEQGDGDKGQERTEEEAGGQEQTSGQPEEKAEEVGEKKTPEQVQAQVDQVTQTTQGVDAQEKPVQQTAQESPASGEETEVNRLRRELAEIRLHLAEQAERTQQAPQQTQAMQAETGKQILRFLQDDNAYDEVTKNADSFNILLTTVVNTAVERSLRMIPQVATSLVDSQMNLRTYVDEFYRQSEDLLPYRKYVGFVTNEVASEHPDWKLEDILKETEERSRTRLKLPKIVEDTNSRQPVQNSNIRTVQQQPAFVPGRQGGRKGTVQTDSLTGQEKQISDLLS